MKLVHLDNYQVVVSDELLLLTPFKTLYKKDKSKDKQYFYSFLTILYFTYDPRSDYSYIVDEKERLKEVCLSNGIEFKKFTVEEQACIDLYVKLTTTLSLELLKGTKIFIDKLRRFLETVDLNERDEKGKLILQPQQVASTIKQIPQMTRDLQETEKLVTKEIEEQGRARGGSDSLSIFDGGFDGI